MGAGESGGERPRRGRPRRGTPTLTRAVIAAEAIEAIEADGLERLSMRGLARRLGVDPMSLYNHVEHREDLLDAVTHSVLAEVVLPPPSGDLRRDVRASADVLRRALMSRPHCAVLVLTRQLSTEKALAPIEHVLALGADAGWSDADTVHAMRAVLAYIAGALLREANTDAALSGRDDEAVEERVRTLETSGLPRVAAAARTLAQWHHDEEFDHGLELMLDGLTARPTGTDDRSAWAGQRTANQARQPTPTVMQ